jgi:hypothetical protein
LREGINVGFDLIANTPVGSHSLFFIVRTLGKFWWVVEAMVNDRSLRGKERARLLGIVTQDPLLLATGAGPF